MKSSSQKNRDCNISCMQDSTQIFSNEKSKGPCNKSAEEERDEMSTTINFTTTNNDASSIFLDD